jgi:outer membrane protein TolC
MKIRALSVATVVALSAGASSARAAEPATDVPAMSLADALAYARLHLPIVKVARARIAASQAAAAIPKGQWLPQLGATGQLFGSTANNTTNSYLGDPAIDIPRIGGTPANASTSWKPYASTFAGVSVTQELFDFGRIAAQTAAFDALTEIDRLRADLDLLDIELGVREAYYAVEGAKSVVTAADAAYARAKTHRDFSAAAVANKLRAPVELARAEADLARFDVGRIRAKGGLDLARGLYSAAVGSPAVLLDTTGSPTALPPMPTLEQAVADAGKRDPALKALIAATKAQEATTTAIGAETRPNIYLSSTLSARAGGAPAGGTTLTGNGFLPSVPNWDVGVVVAWPIFDGVIEKRKEASKAKEETLHAEIDLQKQKQLAAVRRAWFDVRVAESSLPALEKAQEAAKLTYGQTEARFKEGLATTIELADAEALLADAEIQLAIGRFELMRRRAIFSRVVAEGA